MSQKRDFSCEATVYVWKFGGPNRPGHAAVKIAGVPGADKEYISWWPGGSGAGKGEERVMIAGSRHATYKRDMYSEMGYHTRQRLIQGALPGSTNGFQARTGQRIVNTGMTDLETGPNQWGQDAQVKIKLPGLGAAGVAFGLDLVKMVEWWRVFKCCPHPTYKFASKNKNCSGVAAAALRAGGADKFAAPPAAAMFIDPNQVADWAKKLRAAFDRRNGAVEGLKRAAMVAGDEVRSSSAADVMSVKDWTTLSNRDMNGSLMRSEKIRELDKLLKSYHSYPWSDAMAFHKLKLVGEMMDCIHYYLGHKPSSKRGDAVISLGLEIMNVAQTKGNQYRTTGVRNQAILWTQKDLTLEN